MLEVMIEEVSGLSVYGIRTTMTYIEETSPAWASTAKTWANFNERVAPLLELGATVYSVYTNFRACPEFCVNGADIKYRRGDLQTQW